MKHKLCAAAALILTVMLLLSACSGGGADAAKVDVGALTKEMQAAARLPEMLAVRSGDSKAERGFAAISDMDYDKVEAFSLLYAADGSAYELAVIRLKDAADAQALRDSLQKHITKRAEQYRQYDPSQVSRAGGAAVAVHGEYAALIMCDDNAAVKAVFDKAFAS